MTNLPAFEFKVVMIGAVAVGKTSIANRLQFQVFEDDYQPTIGAGYIPYKTEFNGKLVELQIWDTAGMEKYKSLGSIYYRDSNAAILVYDQSSQESADALDSWLNIFKSSVKSDVIIAVAANKDDLPKKVVDNAKMEEWANQQHYPFFVTSAKTGVGIQNLFNKIIELLMESATASSKEKIKLRSTKGCC
ncbi:small GTP-binding protein, putative [Trichomonas vaginalis G3]|uniref:Small GTP-binding protein, putative n=1 Tax=Trichomonas vaginalis (strain ATCC PRA-98 / G3) TaxID=412133 RepID=A2D8P5_TRIV3|nr:GTPase protein [Trichomonas vaginalis G3]EAY23294.1 small GTP-binding protein, putative [Trichomonas vaginalis G3]KAI5534058.1 GTPase protein [Trichomonas vaginalis G3]|eukprot:XP_001584280.1 small GTP-binding protein [Trichomonas vaginalis G3]